MASNAPDGRTTGDSEHIRIGQWIAEQRLQQHPSHGQQAADTECGQQARQAHFEHDRTDRLVRARRRMHASACSNVIPEVPMNSEATNTAAASTSNAARRAGIEGPGTVGLDIEVA